MSIMKPYLDLLKDIRDNGEVRPDRTGTGTKSVFGRQMRWNLLDGFPLLTERKLFTKSIVNELLWFLEGSTDNKRLAEHYDCKIWNEWATESGELGPIYGKQWRKWTDTKIVDRSRKETMEASGYTFVATSIDGQDVWTKERDQITELMEGLAKRPHSRRHIVNAWNVADLPDESITPQQNAENGQMALPPCHLMFQFYVSEMTFSDKVKYVANTLPDNVRGMVIGQLVRTDSPEESKFLTDLLKESFVPDRKLSCQLYQRSADACTGLAFNIPSYALLTHMIAVELGMAVGDYVHTIGDAHIYNDHLEGLEELLTRSPKGLPKLQLAVRPNLFTYRPEDISFKDYTPGEIIKFPISV